MFERVRMHEEWDVVDQFVKLTLMIDYVNMIYAKYINME